MLSTISHGLADNVPQAISGLEIREASDGWDSASQTFLLKISGTNIGGAIDEHFPRWTSHPSFSQLYLKPPRYREIGGNTWEVDAEYQGVTYDRGFQQKIKCFGESSSGENISLTQDIQDLGYPAFVAKLKLEQVVISVETTYISTSVPSLLKVKLPVDFAKLPAGHPGVPTAPTSFWLSIQDPTYVYPSGWLLDNLEPEQMGQAPLYKITDRIVFRHMVDL